MTRIKICGITNLEDGLQAAAAGTDALGFVFVPNTPRYIAPGQAQSIIRQMPPFLTNVGLFVDAELAEMEEIISLCRLDAVQLHGSESVDLCHQLQIKVIKAFHVRVTPENSIEKDQQRENLRSELSNYQVDAYLLDTFVKGKAGGTGQTFNWELSTGLGDRTILAGGLNPENIRSAVSQVHPYGVDVSSGVEAKPGKKDPEKVRTFVHRVRQFDFQLVNVSS